MREIDAAVRRQPAGNAVAAAKLARALRAAAALAVAAAIAGCGGSGGSGGAGTPVLAKDAHAASPCPGASSCPYARALSIGRRGSNVMRYPEAIAVGPEGDVYVGDQYSHIIQVFSTQGRFLRQWGANGSKPGQLGAVDGIAVGAEGDVYVVDSSHDRVEKYTRQGRFLLSFGRSGAALGEMRFGEGEGPDKPPGGGIAVGGGYVYVSDTLNDRIERFTTSGKHPIVLVGKGKGDGQVLDPRGLEVTSHALYVADDGNHRIDELTLSGKQIAKQSVFPSEPSQFADPYDVALTGGRVYVVDDNHARLVIFGEAGLPFLRTWGGYGYGSLQLSPYFRAVASGPEGNLFVADTGNNRIEVFEPSGKPLRSWGVNSALPGQFVRPLGVATASNGDVMTFEPLGTHSPLSTYSPSFKELHTWTKGGNVVLGQNWFAPTYAAFAPGGTVWVTDRDNDLVRHLGSKGEFLGMVGPEGREPGRFLEPAGVAVDSSADLYVADSGNHRIEKFASDGSVLAVWHGSEGHPLRRPTGIALDSARDLYVIEASSEQVVELSSSGEFLSSFGGRGSAPGRFVRADGITVDSSGDVFVSDGALDRIQAFGPEGKLLASWGGEGTALGEMNEPNGLAVDCKGDLLVAETGNNRIAIFTHVAAKAVDCRR